MSMRAVDDKEPDRDAPKWILEVPAGPVCEIRSRSRRPRRFHGYVNLTWLDLDNLDERHMAGATAMLEAARAVDFPHRAAQTVSAYRAWLRHGWDANRPLTALARDDRGRVVGVLEVELPHWDNTHIGVVGVTVDPSARRRGLGRTLLETGMERLRSEGRTVVIVTCAENHPGTDLLKSLGFEPAMEDVVRRQDLPDVDWPRLDREYAAAEPHAIGYELIRMPGEVPDDMVDAVLRMTAAINDAPIGALEIEDEVFTVERLRAFEAAERARDRRTYRVAARHQESGELAGHTVVGVDAEQPGYGFQYDTSVLRAHRGHRLGLLLKIAMMRWLGETEPQLRYIFTGNAASNSYMIRVNELLGYQVVIKYLEWQRRL
jgi:ribosomal protein S18 acetylase RimI-like enzyme